jgi:hypothetical protein
MMINYGDLVTCQIDPIGDADVFRFLGSVGEVVTIHAVRVSGGAPCLELFNPEGTRIGFACGGPTERIDARLTKTGLHTIRMSESGNDEILVYALSLERVAPPSPSATLIRFAHNLDGEINPAADVDLFFFGGVVGDTVTVQASWLSGLGSPCLELFDPEGNRIGFACGGSTERIDARLTKTGPHTIRMSEAGNNQTLVFRIDLQCVGQCPSVPFATIANILTGCTTCRAGDVFSARASISNPTSPTARWLEAKAGVFLPDRTPVNLLGDKHIELPPGFTFDGEVFRMTLPTMLPAGAYQFCGLLLERELGEPVAKSCQTFTIGP